MPSNRRLTVGFVGFSKLTGAERFSLKQDRAIPTGDNAMTDERTLLEQRVARLEREMVRLLWAKVGCRS
jgi:hypothetical protein